MGSKPDYVVIFVVELIRDGISGEKSDDMILAWVTIRQIMQLFIQGVFLTGAPLKLTSMEKGLSIKTGAPQKV